MESTERHVTELAAEVLAALVLCALYWVVSIPASVRTFLIHLLSVSLETGSYGLVLLSYKESKLERCGSVLFTYSSIQVLTQRSLSNVNVLNCKLP